MSLRRRRERARQRFKRALLYHLSYAPILGEATSTDDEAGFSLVIIMIAASGLPQCGVLVNEDSHRARRSAASIGCAAEG